MYILLFYNLLNADMTIHDLFNSLKNNVTRKQLFIMQLYLVLYFLAVNIASTINKKGSQFWSLFLSFSRTIEI